MEQIHIGEIAGRQRVLMAHHAHMLEAERAISRAAILARRPFSAQSGLELQELGLAVHPTPGIVIPIWPVASLPGQTPIYAYRPDKPADPKRKYYWPAGVRARLDLAPLARDLINGGVRDIYLVEGWLKADALASAGLAAVALLGTSAFGWKPEPALPILHDWEALPLAGLRYRIIFDSDTERKDGVALARLRLTALLISRGAEVEWVVLPDAASGGKLGADDWLALGNAAEDIEGLVVQPDGNPYTSAPLDTIGDAQRFAYGNADRARWDYTQKCWVCWDGERWDALNQERVKGFAHETAREAQIAAARLPNEHAGREAVMRHVSRLGFSSQLNAMVEESKDILRISHETFDANPWLLTCANGTIDLRTGALLPHDPADLITLRSPIAYDPLARLPEWDEFLAEVTDGDVELLQFLQAALGYSLTGDTSEERLFMTIGRSRTGKTTLMVAVAAAMGEYAKAASFDSFLAHAGGSGAPREDIARLAGARLVTASEVDEGKRLAEAVVKQLTGGDPVSARHLYKGTFQFTPQLHLWLIANDEPRVNARNEAMWERILRIPFSHYFGEAERDRSLKERLRDPLYAGPAVLAWLVGGGLRWQREGLKVPAGVRSSTTDYQGRMDPIQDWLEDDCLVSAGSKYPVGQAHPDYLAWCKKNAVDRAGQLGRNTFSEAMAGRGFSLGRTGEKDGPRCWVGVAKRPPQAASQSNGHESYVWGEVG